MTQKRHSYYSLLKSLLEDPRLDIQKMLNMFDKILEEDERVIELMAEREARGRIAGKIETLAIIIEAKFPTLADEARHKLQYVKRHGDLDLLAKLVVKAPNKETVRWMLDSLAVYPLS